MIVNQYKEIIVGRQKSTHLYEYLALKPPVYMTAFLKKKTEGFFSSVYGFRIEKPDIVPRTSSGSMAGL